MKIVSIVRTRDEEKYIEAYCESRQWCDQILVADGGSLDNTIDLAKRYKNVQVREFTLRKEMENGLWRNPEAEHINFLVEWALDEGADWIFFSDCDVRPNVLIKNDIRKIVEEVSGHYDSLYIPMLYLWRDNQFFPQMSIYEGVWQSGIWGWHRDLEIKFTNSDMAFEFTPIREEQRVFELQIPYCLLHFSWTNEEIMSRKLEFYDKSGQIPNIKHPLEMAGELRLLPAWARE